MLNSLANIYISLHNCRNSSPMVARMNSETERNMALEERSAFQVMEERGKTKNTTKTNAY